MAVLQPVGHGQALTAQLLAANAAPAMGPIRTVAPQQLQSRSVNLMDEVQKDRAFNRDFYKQRDAQQAAISLEGQRQRNALALEGERNKNALNRLELSDKKEIARAKVRSNHELEMKKQAEAFQVQREEIMMNFKGEELDRELKKLEDLQAKTQRELDARLDRELEAIRKENDRVRDNRKEDEEEQYQKEIENSAGLAEQARQFTDEYNAWVGGDNQRFLDDANRQELLMLPRKQVMNAEGDVIADPSDEEYLRFVEFTPEERQTAMRRAKARYDSRDTRIRNNYQMIPRMNIKGNYMDESLYNPNALTPGSPPAPNRSEILNNINSRNARIQEIEALLSK